MAFPLIPVALGAAALGGLWYLGKAGVKGPSSAVLPAAPQALPKGQPVPVPFNPAAPLAKPDFDRPAGVSEPVFLTYDPYRQTVAQQARAFRYLGIANLFPLEIQGPDDPDFVETVSNFQDWAKLPRSGKIDPVTQTAIDQQVAAKNAILHNKNVAAGLPDTDWVTEQNKLGAADPRGAWKVGGRQLVRAGLRPLRELGDDRAIDAMQRKNY